MLMPEPDAEVIGRRQKIADDLRAALEQIEEVLGDLQQRADTSPS